MDGVRTRLNVGESIFAAVFVLGSALTWWGAASLGDSIENSPLLLVIGMFLAALSFGVLIVIEPVQLLIVRVAVAAGFLLAIPIVFLGNPLVGVPVAVLGAFLAVAALWRAQRLRDALRVVKTVQTARRSLPIYFSGISIVLTGIVFLSPMLATAVTDPVPEPLIRLIVRWVDPLLKPMLGFSIDQDVDTLIQQITEAQLQRVQEGAQSSPGAGVNPKGIGLDALDLSGLDLSNLPPDALKLNPKIIAEQRQAYGERLGITIEGDDDIAAILSKLIRRQTERFEKQLAVAYRTGFVISAFFLFQLFALPFAWLTILLLLAVLPLLKGIKVATLTTKQEPRTILRWTSQSGEPERVEENVE